VTVGDRSAKKIESRKRKAEMDQSLTSAGTISKHGQLYSKPPALKNIYAFD
jgi:hypothetical protein